MEEETRAVLDLTDCKSIMDFHRRIKEDLLFPDHYGCNWDAFLDSMTVDSPVDYVEIRGEHSVAKNLEPALKGLHECLEIVKNRYKSMGWRFEYHVID